MKLRRVKFIFGGIENRADIIEKDESRWRYSYLSILDIQKVLRKHLLLLHFFLFLSLFLRHVPGQEIYLDLYVFDLLFLFLPSPLQQPRVSGHGYGHVSPVKERE